ncbi:MAG: ABC transporter ATP-binding protein [Cytophagales bacterium]|nr:MAG: ABC transporter ATP-binding protein [Cytophagales bacterium]
MSEQTQDTLLEVNNLEVRFTTDRGIIKAVDNVSFTLKQGETLGIVGESGSGKSVTTLAIMQLLADNISEISKGEIIFNATKFGRVNLLSMNKEQMREIRGGDIAMIFQEPMTSLNPVYTCGSQVVEAIMLHQEDVVTKAHIGDEQNKRLSYEQAKQRTLELFKQVQLAKDKEGNNEAESEKLERIFNSYPHELSGGQKQRVMIAMALSCEPKLLIADEPTTALDVTVQKEILELLFQLRLEHNTAIIFITHDLGVIAEIADKVMVMYQGRIMEKDDVMNIFDNPQHPYTKGLLACRPRLDWKLRVLPIVDDFMEITEDGEIKEKQDHKKMSLGNILIENILMDEEIEERIQNFMTKPPILEIKNLKKYFPKRKGLFGKITEYEKAVDDVSFKVYPGETIGLVGESGCGKSTLGRTILRLTDPTEGEIIFEGKRINDYNRSDLRRLRKDIQIIFQDPYASLNPRISIGAAIIEPMRIHNVMTNDKQRKDKIIHILEKVGLKAEHYGRYPHEFSGGQRQRVCIARTLALEPKFIICDESVSALDVSVQAKVLNLLNELKEEFNLTYIFISHDLSVVKFMSDRIIVMYKGKIEEIDKADEIYEKPQTDYTRRLINAIPKGSSQDIMQAQRKRNEMIQSFRNQ